MNDRDDIIHALLQLAQQDCHVAAFAQAAGNGAWAELALANAVDTLNTRAEELGAERRPAPAS
jgi:hypothetical protein